mgnify:CR=1 FL=1
MENTLKQKLAAGARPIGTFFDTASVSLMECLGRTGLDFAIIDNEHSPIEAETTAALVRASELSGICPLARVREISPKWNNAVGAAIAARSRACARSAAPPCSSCSTSVFRA